MPRALQYESAEEASQFVRNTHIFAVALSYMGNPAVAQQGVTKNETALN